MIHIINTFIFSLAFPHYYHCSHYTTTTHINITLTIKNDCNDNENDSNDNFVKKNLKNNLVKKAKEKKS